MTDVEEPDEQEQPAPRGPLRRVKVARGWPKDEYMDMPLEAAQQWDRDAWRQA